MVPLWLIDGEKDPLTARVRGAVSFHLELGKVGGVVKSLPPFVGERGTVVEVDLLAGGKFRVKGHSQGAALIKAFLQGHDGLAQVEKRLAGFAAFLVEEVNDACLVHYEIGLGPLPIRDHAERGDEIGRELFIADGGKIPGIHEGDQAEEQGWEGEARCHDGLQSE